MPTENRLITTFAHDLRVPLRSIVMTTQRLQRKQEELSAEMRSRLDEILAAAHRQEELIAAVVEYDQALLPGLSDDNPLALRLAIQTACMKVDAYRLVKGGTILHDSDGIPEALAPAGIARVIAKVLHNSLKFQLPGNLPKIEVEAAEAVDGTIAIRVFDNGLGIEPEYRDAVFEPFKRLNSPSDYPGSGLGLSICRRLIGSIGGTIRIEGGSGTRVVVTFPKAGLNGQGLR